MYLFIHYMNYLVMKFHFLGDTGLAFFAWCCFVKICRCYLFIYFVCVSYCMSGNFVCVDDKIWLYTFPFVLVVPPAILFTDATPSLWCWKSKKKEREKKKGLPAHNSGFCSVFSWYTQTGFPSIEFNAVMTDEESIEEEKVLMEDKTT